MSKKKSRHRRRENPLKKRQRIDASAAYELGEQILATGLGNLLLDAVYPRPDGPRRPCLSLSPVKSKEEYDA